MLIQMGGERDLNKLHISLCGGFSLQILGKGDIKVANRKACALLAFLSLSKTGSETRERLSGLLWSDRSEVKARASLRQCIKQIRKVFDDAKFDGFSAGHREISLSKELVQVDVLENFEELLEGKVSRTLLADDGLPERILYGFDTISNSYTAWLYIVRQNWRDRLLEELQKSLSSISGADSKKTADALVNIDPTHEPAYRHLIRHYANLGHTSAAIRQYTQLWEVLDCDYDMEPDDKTQALIAEVKLGTYEKQSVQKSLSAGSSLGIDEKPSTIQHPKFPVLRVQQFVTNGAPKSGNFLAEGFRQDLIVGLVRFRDWIILDGSQLTTASSEINQTDEDMNNPSFQIDGTLHEENDRINLVVTLKNSTSNQYLWSERIVLAQDNWFYELRRFVTRISAGLSIYLTAREIDRQLTKHELSNKTYLQWLEAYRLIWSWDPAMRARAENMFREIIRSYASFAPAYSGLASIFNTEQMIYPGTVANQQRLQEAAKFARIAVSLDPLDVRSQAALAWSYGMTGRHGLAENHHRLVHDLNPNNPVTLISCANGLAMCGDVDTAKKLSDEAVNILPSISPAQWGYLASTRFLCGEYEECVEAADATDWAVPVTAGWKASAVGQLGSASEAQEAGEQFMNYIRPRWQSSKPCTPAQVGNWFLQHCPVKKKTMRDRMREGLAKAGLRTDTT